MSLGLVHIWECSSLGRVCRAGVLTLHSTSTMLFI